MSFNCSIGVFFLLEQTSVRCFFFFFPAIATGRKDSFCPSLLNSLQLFATPLIPPSFSVLQLFFVYIFDPLRPCPSFLYFYLSHAPLFIKFPRHLIAHLCPTFHCLLPLPIPWYLWLLALHPIVFISLCGQTGIPASGPPLIAPLWDLRFSPGKGELLPQPCQKINHLSWEDCWMSRS